VLGICHFPGFLAAMEAARKAGIEKLTLLEEPAAAFYSWIANDLARSQKALWDGQTVLVCDVGGGTSDFTLIRVSRDGDRVEILECETPFYAEGGGQVGDRGIIRTSAGEVEVHDTQKPTDGLWVHQGVVTRGVIEVAARAELLVDGAARSATRRNHSATHLLHFALRTVLGAQAMQKGSLVGPDRLRFDYSGTRPLTPEEILRIEDLVNERVLANHAITTEQLGYDDAKVGALKQAGAFSAPPKKAA